MTTQREIRAVSADFARRNRANFIPLHRVLHRPPIARMILQISNVSFADSGRPFSGFAGLVGPRAHLWARLSSLSWPSTAWKDRPTGGVGQ